MAEIRSIQQMHRRMDLVAEMRHRLAHRIMKRRQWGLRFIVHCQRWFMETRIISIRKTISNNNNSVSHSCTHHKSLARRPFTHQRILLHTPTHSSILAQVSTSYRHISLNFCVCAKWLISISCTSGYRVIDESVAVSSTDEKSKATESSKVRRPMNAFMLFAKRHRHVVREYYPNYDNRTVSKILSEWWYAWSADCKRQYREMAEEIKSNHYRDHPAFKWKTSPPSSSLSAGESKSAKAATAKCRVSSGRRAVKRKSTTPDSSDCVKRFAPVSPLESIQSTNNHFNRKISILLLTGFDWRKDERNGVPTVNGYFGSNGQRQWHS